MKYFAKMMKGLKIMDLTDLRNEIDSIDEDILKLFLKRMDVCRQVADYKKEHSLPVMQGGREAQVIERIREMSPDNIKDGSEVLFANIMDISKSLQQIELAKTAEFPVPEKFIPENAKLIAVPGTVGSYSEKACRKLFPNQEIKFYREFSDVCRAVENGETDFGILPIQNSTAGTVDETYDLMGKFDFYITSMIRVSISHCLAAKQDTDFSEITAVYSHEQALHQCSEFLRESGLTTHEYANTALSAELVKNSPEKLACICSEDCAKLNGLKIIKSDIANAGRNSTRFICISKKYMVSDDADTISVSLSIPHVKGSLYRLLSRFYVNGLNLRRIESKPIAGKDFEVVFYLDFGGNCSDVKTASLIRELQRELSFFKYMGNFKEIM